MANNMCNGSHATLYYSTLRLTLLHYAALYYATLYNAALSARCHSSALRYMTLHYAPLSYTMPHSPTLCHTILHYSHYAKRFCTTLYDSTLRPTLLHYATLSYTKPRYSTHKRPSNDEPYLSTQARTTPGSTDTTPLKYLATCRRMSDAAPYLPLCV